ncbi:MAG: T9SS type A sorting domain-containing protein [Taibaiella sp.]|nr:T9SS type A sorting domain-containing protein [Taibaiella sp.]
MKRSLRYGLFILTLLILNPVEGYLQTVFAPVGATWIYADGVEDTHAFTFADRKKYTVEKDTVFKGVSCRKVVIHDYGFSLPSSSYHHYTGNAYYYTNGDSVFRYSELFDRFVLYLRFDVSEGDTLYYPLPEITNPEMLHEDSSFCVIVDSVRMVTLDNGEEVRRIYNHVWLRDGIVEDEDHNYYGFQHWYVTMAEGGGGYYTERLGTIEYKINPLSPAVTTDEKYFDIMCYSENDVLYTDPYRIQPCLSVPPMSIAQTDPFIHVICYPNPASGLLNIHIQSLKNLGTAKIWLSDIAGGTVMDIFQGKISNGSDWRKATAISRLPNGVYLLHIQSESGSTHQLVIKQ